MKSRAPCVLSVLGLFLMVVRGYKNSCGFTRMDLGSEILDGTWTAENSNGSIKVPAQVPGSIYTDLETSRVVEPLYYRFNDQVNRWVSKEDWTYYRNFTVESSILSKKRVVLICDGLDTISTVLLNNEVVGASDNMFVRYIFDVKNQLKEGDNVLQVAFTSPVKWSKLKYEEQAKKYPVLPSCVPPEYRGECHANHIRKQQSSFAWDWGPAAPTMGIWKPIALESYDCAVIRDIMVTTTPKSSSTWTMTVTAFLDLASDTPVRGILEMTLGTKEGNVKKLVPVLLTPDHVLQANVSDSLTLTQGVHIDLWWPNGYGSQSLYNLSVSFQCNDTGETSSKTARVGFRTVELIQEPIANATGLTFHFLINGLKIFMKGSNWIPAHVLPERVNPEHVRELLQYAARVNMNMLRVWGGGVYESDDFYELTDQLGILIWQDSMFACSMYPVWPEFLQSVNLEVETQVLRLQHHASIAVWASNNENEAALRQNWYSTSSDFEQYKADYITLYVDTIRTKLLSLDQSRPFLVSSPSNGVESEKEGYIAKDPQSHLYGDVHFYDYIHNGWDWKTYPRGRFASEFGTQSWPSFHTLASVSIPVDWSLQSDFTHSRQHHLLGNEEIMLELGYHLHVPSHLDTEKGFKSFIYLSQVNQAMSMKTEVEFYRRSQSEIEANGEGLTSGALMWQLDDTWQGASWATIEYGGTWKMAHYFIQNFYSPLVVSPFVNTYNELEVYAVSDLRDQTDGLTLHVYLHRWKTFMPISHEQVTFNQPGQNAQSVSRKAMSSVTDFPPCNEPDNTECFLYFKMEHSDGKAAGPDNFLFLHRLDQAAGLQPANLSIANVTSTYKVPNYAAAFKMTIKADRPAPFVWLEAPGIRGHFQDNGFLMLVPETCVEFYSKDNVTQEEFQKSLQIQSLMDVYQ